MTNKILCGLVAVMMFSVVAAQPSYREKYADVLRQYSEQEGDSLKYRAALFLIDNMDGHLSPEGEPMERYADFVRTMKKTTGIRELQAGWNEAAKGGTVAFMPDSAIVDNTFLKANVDEAFAAWEQAAWRDKISFGQFCRYILPYRVNDEHIDSTQVTAQVDIERIVDGIVEKCDTLKYAKTPIYLYTTVESHDSLIVLMETHEPTTYELLFPKLPDSANESKRLQDFKEYIYASFCRIGNVEHALAGKKLGLSFYIKSDGSVVCHNIGLTSQEKLVDYIVCDEIRQMVNEINSYRFKPSEISGKYYLFSGIFIRFPEK